MVITLFVLFMFVLCLPLIIAVMELTIGKGTTLSFCRISVEVVVSTLKSLFGEEHYLKGAVILLVGAIVAFGLLATSRGILFSQLDGLESVPVPISFNQ